VAEEFRDALPFVIPTVDVSDGGVRQLFIRNVIQAAQVDSEHLPDWGFSSDTEGSNTAVLAKVMMVLLGVESVLSQLRFARKQSKAIGPCHGWPKACSPADRAVASVGALSEIEVGFEFNSAAVTTAMVRLQHLASSLKQETVRAAQRSS
jgi:hypothetical protein